MIFHFILIVFEASERTVPFAHKSKRKNLSFIVSEEEGEFIRKLRWEGIRNKIL